MLESPWFYWALGVAIGLPVVLMGLTEGHQALARRQSYLARPVNLLRNYLVPLGALLLLLVNAAQVPLRHSVVRGIATVFGFLVLVLLLSGLNAAVFQNAPEGTWRKRVPGIFLDVARFLLIGVGLAVIFSYIWGVRIGGLFTALGVTSVVIGLMLQNARGTGTDRRGELASRPYRHRSWSSDHAELGAGRHIIHESEPTGRCAQIGDHDHVFTHRPARSGVRDAVASRQRAAAASGRHHGYLCRHR
jgi:hypothetical protein